MAHAIILPKQGLQMDEGTILRWIVEEGRKCIEGQPLFEMETDKLTITIDAPASGTLLKILHPEGDTVRIAETIAIVGDEGEDISTLLPGAEGSAPPIAAPPVADSRLPYRSAETEKPGISAGTRKASPRAAALAREKGVDLSMVPGADGMIREKDVLAYLESGSMKEEDEWVPLSATRKAIAGKLHDAQKRIAWATIRMDVNMSQAKAHLEDLKASGLKVSYHALIIAAIAQALKGNPIMNSVWMEDGILLKRKINIGFAVATVRGLMVPVIRDADRKSMAVIAEETRALADKARAGTLTVRDVSDGTFTLSNLGMMGVQSGEAIPNPPETGILCAGQIKDGVIAENGVAVIAPMMTLTLTYDHRVLDGADAAGFANDVRSNLLGCRK